MPTGVCVAGMVAALPALSLEAGRVEDLIHRLRSKNDSIRGPAWQRAESVGASAVKALAEVMVDPDFEFARAAKRALCRIVRHAGRPGADEEARTVVAELVPLLKSAHASVRRDAVWLLSEIAGNEAIEPMSALLSDPEAREDARCALMRFSSRKATSAFKAALLNVPEEFKAALAETLRQRGVKLKGYPSQKVVPSRKTEVGVQLK